MKWYRQCRGLLVTEQHEMVQTAWGFTGNKAVCVCVHTHLSLSLSASKINYGHVVIIQSFRIQKVGIVPYGPPYLRYMYKALSYRLSYENLEVKTMSTLLCTTDLLSRWTQNYVRVTYSSML